jgi:hypothetical protein
MGNYMRYVVLAAIILVVGGAAWFLYSFYYQTMDEYNSVPWPNDTMVSKYVDQLQSGEFIVQTPMTQSYQGGSNNGYMIDPLIRVGDYPWQDYGEPYFYVGEPVDVTFGFRNVGEKVVNNLVADVSIYKYRIGNSNSFLEKDLVGGGEIVMSNVNNLTDNVTGVGLYEEYYGNYSYTIPSTYNGVPMNGSLALQVDLKVDGYTVGTIRRDINVMR